MPGALIILGDGLDEISQILLELPGFRVTGPGLEAELDPTDLDLEGADGIAQCCRGLRV